MYNHICIIEIPDLERVLPSQPTKQYHWLMNHAQCYRCGSKAERAYFISNETSRRVIFPVDDDISNPLTKDHFLPRSLFGGGMLSNMKPACKRCNTQRGDKLTADELTVILADIGKFAHPLVPTCFVEKFLTVYSLTRHLIGQEKSTMLNIFLSFKKKGWNILREHGLSNKAVTSRFNTLSQNLEAQLMSIQHG